MVDVSVLHVWHRPRTSGQSLSHAVTFSQLPAESEGFLAAFWAMTLVFFFVFIFL